MEGGNARPPELGLANGSWLSRSRKVGDDRVELTPRRGRVHPVDTGVELPEVKPALGAVLTRARARGETLAAISPGSDDEERSRTLPRERSANGLSLRASCSAVRGRQ